MKFYKVTAVPSAEQVLCTNQRGRDLIEGHEKDHGLNILTVTGVVIALPLILGRRKRKVETAFCLLFKYVNIIHLTLKVNGQEYR